MNFIFNHMFESLVVGWTKENHDFHFFTTKTIIHNLIATKLVAKIMKLTRKSLDSIAISDFPPAATLNDA